MAQKVVKRAPKKKAANAYKLPDPISTGEILTDIAKRQWFLGKSIGVGGFGEIYCGTYSYLPSLLLFVKFNIFHDTAFFGLNVSQSAMRQNLSY